MSKMSPCTPILLLPCQMSLRDSSCSYLYNFISTLYILETIKSEFAVIRLSFSKRERVDEECDYNSSSVSQDFSCPDISKFENQ